ncbi:MAG TPA: ankyrin repeat domain-containing protein [Pyrinomonadaceae bacterium]|nr:ankyrin repeat domain-containing protein [Pyrinomonadaceae bacterium]
MITSFLTKRQVLCQAISLQVPPNSSVIFFQSVLLRALALLPPLFLLTCFFLVAGGIEAQERTVDKEFLNAVEQRDIARINATLARGANINAKESINGHFALQYAINWPDENLVKLLLEKGADVNLTDSLGDTALIEAARGGGPEYVKIVSLLLSHGADVHVANDAAIFAAAKRAEPEVLRMLVDKGALVNAKDNNQKGDTVLMAAASGVSAKKLQMLLAAGADLKVSNDDGETALMKAVQLQHSVSPADRLPMIELLLKSGANVNAVDKRGNSPLLLSVVQFMSEAGGIIAHPEIVRFLLDHGANAQSIDAHRKTALMIAAVTWKGSLEIPQLLIDKGAQVDAQDDKGVSALMLAADKDKLDLVQLLLTKNARLELRDLEGATALDYAVEEGHDKVAKLLLSKGAPSRASYQNEKSLLDDVRNFALLRAAYTNSIAEVRGVTAGGADLNFRNRRGDSALMLAIENSYGNNEVAEFLVERGSDVNATNGDGDTPLMIAASGNNAGAVKILLDHKADVRLVNKKRQTALHIASASLHSKIVAAILAGGAQDVNQKDGDGRTPLLLAADNDSFVPGEVMDSLLSKGASIDTVDSEGNTALILAAKQGNMSGVEYLLKKGAKVDQRNANGETALVLAKRIHENKQIGNAELVQSRVVEMLLKAGAR